MDMIRRLMNFQILRSSQTWLTIAVLLMISYQLLYTQGKFYDASLHRIIHLSFAFIVVLLAILVANPASRLKQFFIFFLIAVSVGIAVQLIMIFDEALTMLVFPPLEATVAALIGLLFCFALTWVRYGKLFIILTLIAFAYAIVGPYILPEAIQPPQVSILRLIAWLAGDIAYDWGVYGQLVSLMANYIWLFMVFGAFLQAFGGLGFIHKLGLLVSSKSAGGPATLAVVTSALVGMVTGSTASNVAITGSFTIPLMKKHGYTSEEAGAIELAASSGGQILPPIMGVVAFLMADFIGMPYARVIYHALVPALLYFLALLLYVHIQAKKRHAKPFPVEVSVKEILLSAPSFLIPFLVLVVILLQGYSLMFVAFWSIVSVVAVGTISSLLRKELRIDWREAKEKLTNGVVSSSEMTIICGLIGGLLAIGEMSGIGFKLSEVAIKLSGGNLFVLLIFSAMASLILGMGLPTVAAYVLTATVLGQALVSMGIPFIAAHLFLLFFSVFAHCTPPVGLGLVVAQKLAGGNYWRTGKQTLTAAYIVFPLPFFFVYTPAVLLRFEGFTLAEIMMQFVIIFTFLSSMAFQLNSWCIARLGLQERVFFAIGAALPLLAIIFPAQSGLLITIGVVSSMGGIGLSWRRSRNLAAMN